MVYRIINRKSVFLIAIIAFILTGCKSTNNHSINKDNRDEIGGSKEIINDGKEMVHIKFIDINEPIKISVGDTSNSIEENEEKSSNRSYDDKGKDRESLVEKGNLKNSTSKSKKGNKALDDRENKSVDIKEKAEEIKPNTEELKAEIVKKYTELLKDLRIEYESKLTNLLEQAKSEYLGLSDDERAEQKSKLGLKYLRLGRALEEECDKIFYSTLEKMKAELTVNGLENSIADEAENQYKTEKIEGQKKILKKAFEK